MPWLPPAMGGDFQGFKCWSEGQYWTSRGHVAQSLRFNLTFTLEVAGMALIIERLTLVVRDR
jgi:hypothetical protein